MDSTLPGAKQIGDELLSDAKNIGESAVNRMHEAVDLRKGDAAEQVKSFSSAIAQAADDMNADFPAWAKSAVRQGVTKAKEFADAIETKNSRELMNDLNNFARNSPAIFMTLSAFAGFAAARIFKAGSTKNKLQQLGNSSQSYSPSVNDSAEPNSVGV